jgi:calcineurin-like phosphoesterase family protein
MKKIWFTSDTHWGHTNIAGPNVSNWESGWRDFDTLQDMNEAIVEGINSNVDEGDVLYHLGDWTFGGFGNIKTFRDSIKCKEIHLMLGNHDDQILRRGDRSFNPRELFTSINQAYYLRLGRDSFFLSHYPHLSWRNSSRGVIMLHGHEHGEFDELNKNSPRMDVGIDSAKKIFGEYRPFSLEEVIEINGSKNIITPKHH